MSGIIIKLGNASGTTVVATILLMVLATGSCTSIANPTKEHEQGIRGSDDLEIASVDLDNGLDNPSELLQSVSTNNKAKVIVKRQIEVGMTPAMGFEVAPAPPAVSAHGDLTMMVPATHGHGGSSREAAGKSPAPTGSPATRKHPDIKNCAVYMDINGADTFDHCGHQDPDLCNVCRMNTAGCCAPVAPPPANPKATLAANNNKPHRTLGDCKELRGLCQAAGCCEATYSVDCPSLAIPNAEAEVYV